MGAPQGSFNFHIGMDGTVEVAKSLRSLKADVAGLTQAWKAQEINLKSAGDNTAAAEVKYKGLTETVKAQKSVLAELKAKQAELDTSTDKGAESFAKLQKQVSQAEAKLASLSAQQGRAKDTMQYYKTGIAGAQEELKRISDTSAAYVKRLEAEGRTSEANKAKLNSMKAEYSQMNTVYQKQVSELNRIATESGKASSAFAKQSIRVDELGAKMATTKNQMIKLSSETGGLGGKFARLKEQTAPLRTAMGGIFSNVKGLAISTAASIGTVTAAMVSGAQEASALAHSYNETFNLMKLGGESAADATKAVNDMQRDGAEYSVKYGKSQQSIADAYQELIKRGYTGKQALGAMQTELQASVASGDDFSDVISVASQTLEAFGMRADGTRKMTANTKEVVNELAYAADTTSTGFGSLGKGMEYVGTIAKNSKFSLAETAAALGKLSDRGLEADKGGTGLRKVILSLASPTKAAGQALDEINLKSSDFLKKNGDFKSMTDIFALLQKHTESLGSSDKADIFKSIFGTTGAPAAQILATSNKELGELTEKVKKAGESGSYVQQLAQKNGASAQQSVAKFKQSSEALKIMMATQLLPVMSDAADGLSKLFAQKDFQTDIKLAAKQLAEVAQKIVDIGKYAAEHQGQVKALARVLTTMWVASKVLKFNKALRETASTLDFLKKKSGSGIFDGLFKGSGKESTGSGLLSGITGLFKKGGTKAAAGAATGVATAGETVAAGAGAAEAAGATSGIGSALAGAGSAALGVATGPVGLTVAGIAAAGTAATLAYKKIKPFHNFVNGIGADAKKGFASLSKATSSGLGTASKAISSWTKSAGKTIGKWGSSLSKTLSSAMGGLAKGWSKIMAPFGKAWKNVLADKDVKSILKNFNGLKKAASGFGTAFGKQMSKLGKAVSKVWGSLTKEMSKWAKSFSKAWSTLGKNISKLWSAALKTLSKTFAPVIKTMTQLTSAIAKLWSATTKEVAKGLAAISKLIAPFVKVMLKYWSGLWDTMKSITSAAWKVLSKVIGVGLESIKDVLGTAVKIIKKLWDGVWDAFVTILKAAWKVIATVINTVLKALTSVIKAATDLITGNWKGAWKNIVSAFKTILTGIGKIAVTILTGLGKAFTQIVGGIGKAWGVAWRGMATVFSKVWGGLKGIAKGAMNGIIDVLNGAIGAVNGVWHFFSGHNALSKLSKLASGGVIKAEMEHVLVNDDNTADPRELIELPNGQMGMFEGSHVETYLPKGTIVHKSSETKEIFHDAGITKYATGGIVGGIKSLIGNVADKAETVAKWLKNPLKMVTDLIGKSVSGAVGKFATLGADVVKKLTGSIAKWFKKGLKKVSDTLDGGANVGNPSGKSVTRWEPYVKKALKANGFGATASQVAAWMRVIQRESNGDPTAVNNWDSNAKKGIPSKGLVQTIGPTFAAYAFPGHKNILNGYDNLLAGIHYAKSRYGAGSSMFARVSGPLGYANGGFANQASIFGEAGLEAAIPMSAVKSSRGYELLGKTAAAMAARDGMSDDSDTSAKLDKVITLLTALVQNDPATLVAAILGKIQLDTAVTLDKRSLGQFVGTVADKDIAKAIKKMKLAKA